MYPYCRCVLSKPTFLVCLGRVRWYARAQNIGDVCCRGGWEAGVTWTLNPPQFRPGLKAAASEVDGDKPVSVKHAAGASPTPALRWGNRAHNPNLRDELSALVPGAVTDWLRKREERRNHQSILSQHWAIADPRGHRPTTMSAQPFLTRRQPSRKLGPAPGGAPAALNALPAPPQSACCSSALIPDRLASRCHRGLLPRLFATVKQGHGQAGRWSSKSTAKSNSKWKNSSKWNSYLASLTAARKID
ncbi:hypothetical protein BT67DRAFT_14188 [Trichocladium antarcticum]|uniref:Uncharacterized protein n=1 Tax=Trichocladium antarcticum TaxID=1450529 RepID=A0AAN6ZHF9_9PEZI|nr:hypothetical protein BT67DRAFT_14188 [Trichocladium antarcticum]